GVGRIVKTCVAVVTLIEWTGWFRVLKATLDDVLRRTRRTHDAIGPAQLTNSLITLHIIDETLDVDLHGWTPVRDHGMRCRQYTPSSNATTPESNKSVCLIPELLGHAQRETTPRSAESRTAMRRGSSQRALSRCR